MLDGKSLSKQKGLPSCYELLRFGDGRCPGQDAPTDAGVKPSLAPQQAEGLAPACSPPGRGGVTSPTPNKCSFITGHMRKRDYSGFTISSFTLYPVPSPSTLQLFMACFCAAVGSNRTVWMPSRAERSRPACWGPGQSLSAYGLSPEPCIDADPEKIFFFLCELLQLLLICISKTKLLLVTQHPFLHTTICLYQTQTSLKPKNLNH